MNVTLCVLIKTKVYLFANILYQAIMKGAFQTQPKYKPFKIENIVYEHKALCSRYKLADFKTTYLRTKDDDKKYKLLILMILTLDVH